MSLKTRWIIILIFVGYFIGSYFLLMGITSESGRIYDVTTKWDRQIPYMSWTFLIYITVYIVPVAAFLLVQEKWQLINMMKAFGVALLICNIIWYVFPVRFDLRPDLIAGQSRWIDLIIAFYKFDSPAMNCLPSLHVTYAFLTAFSMMMYRRQWGVFFLIVAVLISLSTLTFKQHYIVDVLAGMVLSYLMYWVFLKRSATYSQASCNL